MAQVPPRFYNQQIQQQRDNYQQTKKNYYRAGSSGMSQEHQGSASQVRKISFFNPSSKGDENFAPWSTLPLNTVAKLRSRLRLDMNFQLEHPNQSTTFTNDKKK